MELEQFAKGITWRDVCASRARGSATQDGHGQHKEGSCVCCRGIWGTLQRARWVLGKKRAEGMQGSEPLACRLTFPVALEPSMRFWQWRGEFVPVHDLNLRLSFLLVSLPLPMAPKGKFLLRKRGGKEKPQKQRAEGCGGESNLQGASSLEQRQGCWRGRCSGGGHPHPSMHPGLGSRQPRPAGSCTGGVQVQDVPPNPQRPSKSRSPGAALGPSTQHCAWWRGPELPPPGRTGSRRRRRPWERHRRGVSSLRARSSPSQGVGKSRAEAFLKPCVYVCGTGAFARACMYIQAYRRVYTDARM